MNINSLLAQELYLSSPSVAGKILANEIANSQQLKKVVASIRERNVHRSVSNLRKEIVFNHADEIQQILYIKTHVHVGKYDAELGAVPYVIVPDIRDYSYAGGMPQYSAQNSIHQATLKVVQSYIQFNVTNDTSSLVELSDLVTMDIVRDLNAVNMLKGYSQIIALLSTDKDVNDFGADSELPIYAVKQAGYTEQLEKMLLAANVSENDHLVSLLRNEICRLVPVCGEFSPCLIQGFATFAKTEIFFPTFNGNPYLINTNNRINSDCYMPLVTGVLEVLALHSSKAIEIHSPREISQLLSNFTYQLKTSMKEIESIYCNDFNSEDTIF
ncbi:hypothetical protein [Photobacterium phosphoreum]|jgi:hypothetical protein|uniref:hypothetical protein n=1 Tax=Photobacterium phosphoreum TaxID=659 RepID=UPI0024B75CAD|nr:hypothetical protein [Photobacterium phosphoreum]